MSLKLMGAALVLPLPGDRYPAHMHFCINYSCIPLYCTAIDILIFFFFRGTLLD